MTRRRAYKVDIHGLEYTVLFRTVEQDPYLKGKEGYLDTDKNTITIAADMPETRARDTLVHEIFHGIWDASGLGNYLATQFKRGTKRHEVEEHCIRLLTPAIITALRSAGLLSRKKVNKHGT